ncbi:MAG: SlyX family protein [Exilibacterium sp.]
MMSDYKSLEETVVDLQTRLTFQEDTLQHLNITIAKQDTVITELREQMRSLATKFKDLMSEVEQQHSSTYDDRPPHY